MTLVHPAARSSSHPPHTSARHSDRQQARPRPTDTHQSDTQQSNTQPTDTHQSDTHQSDRDEEVPDMTLTDLLDADAFTTALGEDVPCRQEDPELWFAESPDDVEFAKALCGTCPVQRACLAGAVQRREPWGVWGGQLFIGGVVVARKRPRGRPRKDAAPMKVGVLEASAS